MSAKTSNATPAAEVPANRESGEHPVAPLFTASNVSFAASQLPAERLRLSEIFTEFERLTIEFGELIERAGIPAAIGNEICDMLTDAVVDTRTMLGDELYECMWLVAENAPKTREEFEAEVRARVEGGVS